MLPLRCVSCPAVVPPGQRSRDEARGLRSRLELLQHEAGALAAERDRLRVALAAAQPAQVPPQTGEQLAGVIKDLKKQLRAALQEVKDYEVYKEVMETAVGKMQVRG